VKTVQLPEILLSLADHAGVSLRDILHPLFIAFRSTGGMPRNFRSDVDAPTAAGSMMTDKKRIAFPEALPYIAGVWCMGNVRLTGVGLAPGVTWYGEFTTAKLVMRGTTLPLSIAGGLMGMRLGDVVDHPVLRSLDAIITAPVDLTNGNVTIHAGYGYVGVDDPLEWADERAGWKADLAGDARIQDRNAEIAA